MLTKCAQLAQGNAGIPSTGSCGGATKSKAEEHSILQLDVAGQSEPPFDRMHKRSKTPDGDEVSLLICEVFKVHTKRSSKGYWIVF